MTEQEQAEQIKEMFLDVGIGIDWAKDCAVLHVKRIIKFTKKFVVVDASIRPIKLSETKEGKRWKRILNHLEKN